MNRKPMKRVTDRDVQRLSPTPWTWSSYRILTQRSAALHAGLYAAAHIRGL